MRCLWCHTHFLEKVSWHNVCKLTHASHLCEPCEKKLEEITGEMCEKCGRPFTHLAPEFRQKDVCTDCLKWIERKGALEKNRSLYVYNQFLQEVIAKWKYRGDAELVKLFSELLLSKAKLFTIDIVVPIPLSKERLYERSFNQAKLLAELLPYPLVEVLSRAQSTKKQSKKSRHERLNTAEKFEVVPAHLNELKNQSVLLVDDIYTTGATLYAAAEILKANGAKRIQAITVARG